MTKVSIPEKVAKIGRYAFLRSGVQKIPNAAALLMHGCSIDGLGDGVGDVFCCADDLECAAAIYLTQSRKAPLSRCEATLYADGNATIAMMTKLLAEQKRKPTCYKKAAEFALSCGSSVKAETLQALCGVVTAAKAKAAAELLEKELKKRKRTKGTAIKGATGHPVEAFCQEHFNEGNVTHMLDQCGLALKKLPAVRYRDSEESAPPFVVGCVLAAYLEMGETDGWSTSDFFYHKEADQIAAALDPAAFQQALEKLYQSIDKKTGITKAPRFLMPYCRFGTAEQVSGAISNLKKWTSWSAYHQAGRDTEYLARYAICLNESRTALLWADKNDQLDFVARLRNTTADMLRDTQLSEFGLNEKGEKVYDLGGTTVTAVLAADLSLSLYDSNAGKIVKSIPKKGADPEKYEAAKAGFAEMKKNLTKVAKARCDVLFQDFLSGRSRAGEDWRASYPGNPLLRQVASLLVWSQDGHTFTLKGGQPVDSKGAAYTITDSPVTVAHPMEMERDDVERWQKYFATQGLRQPFAQVWEPVIDFSQVKEDRYSGIELPANQLRGREKHGIQFGFDYSTVALSVSFAGCDLDCGLTDCRHHSLEPDSKVVFGALKVENPSRQANHIIGLLDKWTVEGRILKDDVSAVEHLDSFTLAQVTELLNLAIENQCTNCTAALLAYKNTRFADFDPMDVFTLE